MAELPGYGLWSLAVIDSAIFIVFMFPVLVFMYMRLARREERKVLAEFSAAYGVYMRSTPAFLPRLTGLR